MDSGFSGDETGKGTGAFGVLLPDLRRLRAKERLFNPVVQPRSRNSSPDYRTIIGYTGIVSSGRKEDAMQALPVERKK